MSVDPTTGDSPNGGGRTHGMHRGAGRGRGPLLPRRRSLLPASPVSRAPPDTTVVREARRNTTAHTQRSMLQQMSSSPSAQFGEVATRARPIEGRVCGDASSEASSDTPEDSELPECKIKRNYNCTKCKFYTQNPRAFLVHSRDVHFEKLKIYDCPHCVYASRHHQKLTRHIKMVHEASSSKDYQNQVNLETSQPQEKIEDLFEEIEEYEDVMDVDDCNEESLERIVDGEPSATDEGSKDRGNYYSCSKCNYVTHIRSRYTKHVKYHSMPMIKCTMCEFRTPYKWNLDRHMKNHGGTGNFHCSMCNFTADIKQSLTVHEMNHHTHPIGQPINRRRNRVGASDMSPDFDPNDGSALIMKEEDGSGDSSQCASDMGLQYTQHESEMTGCQSDSNEATTSEMINKEDSQHSQQSHGSSVNVNLDDSKSQKDSRKAPRPIPQLIPLTTSTPNQKSTSGEPPAKKFKESSTPEPTDLNINRKNDHLANDINITPANNSGPKEVLNRKKNESFFDRLKERLLTETGKEGLICKNCGFESKCLSEQSVHEKNCLPQANRTQLNTSVSNLGSTRCQNCRHRCKSSADLYIHMQTCGQNQKSVTENKIDSNGPDTNGLVNIKMEKDAEPHPMENVVFVWNNIHQNANKFETPLDIRINDDSTLPDHKSFEAEIVDDNEAMNLSPSQAAGKKVFKCPHCLFWASTASRFHVHIVGHLNKKPFECSLCKYKSNWRWDITKHIKLKSARDPEHTEAKVLMTDETGRRNYSKYNRFIAISVLNENGENEFHYIDQNAANDGAIDDESFNDIDNMNTAYDMQPLNLQTYAMENKFEADSRLLDSKKPKKTLWKCKKCNYKDTSRDALLEHVREHSKPDESEDKSKKLDNVVDPADLAYRCGHCNQLSNWKHVIQRHCRLKHDGVIKVITTVKTKPDPNAVSNEANVESCIKCPFKSSDKNLILMHQRQHQPSPHSMYKCSYCPFFVKDELELAQHLVLHGVTEPDDYMSKTDSKSPLPEQMGSVTVAHGTKRHKCNECPYETNSKSQYMYHEQFHRISADTPYKCPECNYSVSKRHLLHQHMRVHGIISKKFDMDMEIETPLEETMDFSFNLNEIPYVWVSAKNEFHKMYKCRYCSYVNSQKCKIPNHEDIHCIKFENSEVSFYKCLECKFTCDNRSKLAEHSKTHGEIYGRIYCPVELDVSDEEQIAKLREVIEKDRLNQADDQHEDHQREDATLNENKEIKTLFFCQKCPARFFDEMELRGHDKFHSFNLNFAYKCKSCEFSVPQENDLNSHNFVHTDEYNTRSKMLKFVHKIHPLYKDPKLQFVHCPLTSGITWVAANPEKKNEHYYKKSNEVKSTPKQYNCKECPAKFFKNSALNYHMGLHGGDGEYKCRKCTYAVKNVGNLAKHELLHENANKPPPSADYDSGDDVDYKIPLSGTDLFQRKTEAQKRVLTDKDKLVKPNDHFPPVLQADPQFGYLMHGNPEFIYPTYLKNGRQKEKRYKCHKCPSAFEKREQYKIHLSLHGSKQRYKCELCDYSVKYYANYVQHMRKHQMNDEAQAERKKIINGYAETDAENQENRQEDGTDNIKLAIKTMPKRPPRTDFQQFSISDQQTLRLLQRRRSIENSMKENTDASPVKERKLHLCLLCPYTNQRQDALCNHSRRHDERDIIRSSGNQKCSYCNLVVVQSHFLREHLKTHFSYQKHVNPECFIANENVTFTIKKIIEDEDEEPSVAVDLKLDVTNTPQVTNEDKILVKIDTGELLVE